MAGVFRVSFCGGKIEHHHRDQPKQQQRQQAEFKATHKQVDQVRSTDLRPGELRTEIGQLEDEKKQLTEKISKLKSNVSEEPGMSCQVIPCHVSIISVCQF